MKKINFLVALCLATFLFTVTTIAQPTSPQWVSTEVQKRSVVLEEYTGWMCQFCPDGHRIAQAMAAANPDKIFLINIHTGGYADTLPAVYGWDLRTLEGDALANTFQVGSFPIGSVNRYGVPMLKSRGNPWITTAQQILSQDSPVNVFTKSTVDVDTRKLIVEVEVYYTADASAATNKLTVALTQNEIIGAQVDSGPFYPEMHVQTLNANQGLYLYRHQHVLRKFLTEGHFGEDITTTKKGDYIYKKYEFDLPEYFESYEPAYTDDDKVPTELKNLEVIAFVAEGERNIYTGHSSPIEFTGNYVELIATDKTNYPETLKLEPITPTVEVKNNSGVEVTSFNVEMYANGELQATKKFDGTLNVGETISVEFPEVVFDEAGSYSFGYRVDSTKQNEQSIYFIDRAATVVHGFAGLLEKKIVLDTLGFDGVMPANTILTGENEDFQMANPSTGAYGANSTKGAILFYIHSSWGNAGKPGYIIFGEVDFETVPEKMLSYYYAYSNSDETSATAPKVTVEISKDWGATWELVNETICEITGVAAQSGYIYVPATTDYKKVEISLEDYANTNCLIRVAGVPGTGGNALWIDEIALTDNSSIAEDALAATLYPNPAARLLQIDNELLLGMDYEIFDAAGKLVEKSVNISNTFNVDQLTPGAYTLKINGKYMPFVKK